MTPERMLEIKRELKLKRHPDGTRYVQPWICTDPVSGRPRRPYHRFPAHLTDGECMEEAERWLDDNLSAASNGTSRRLGDVLERYIDERRDQGHPANTIATWRQLARYMHGLAKQDVGEVDPRTIQDLYDALVDHGGIDGKGLSRNTVRNLHWFLRGAFKWMVNFGYMDSSPMAYVTPPRPEMEEAYALDEDEMEVALAAIEAAIADEGEDAEGALRHAAAFAAYIGLLCGLRVGEVCALRMRDVYYDRNLLHVAGTVVEKGGLQRQSYTKSRKARNVAVSDRDLAIISAQRRWRKRRTGKVAGQDRALVSVDGSLMRPSKVSAAVRDLLADAGLPDGITFHTLRHTHATWLLAHGMDLKTVSERLGHANETTTLRTYAHVMDGRDAAAAALLSDALGGKGAGEDG